MCLGQLGSLLPHVVVPSVLAAFLIPEWQLSGAQAGLLAGSGAAGYMLAVPVLATLTDRIDARKILVAGSAVSALGTLLFGLFATGLRSGALFNAIAGIGFAGAYMPGLKALTDRLAPGDSSRAITFYTSSFSFGVGLSFLVAQLVADSFGWRSAFYVTALGPIVMLAVCLLLRPVAPKPVQGPLLDFAPVFRNTRAMGFVLGYGAHCFELYGIRTWLVAFWTFVIVRNGQTSILTPVVVSVVFSLLAMPASILGNELALKFGRHRAITAVMLSSAVVALLIGLFADRSPLFLLPLLLAYAITVPAELRRVDLGHVDGRAPRLSRRNHGGALHRRLQPVGARRLGRRRRTRPRGRTTQRYRLDGGVLGSGGGHFVGSGGALLVPKRRAAVLNGTETDFPFQSGIVSSKTTAWKTAPARQQHPEISYGGRSRRRNPMRSISSPSSWWRDCRFTPVR